MSRGISSQFAYHIAKAQHKMFHLLEVYLSEETIYITDAYRTLTWNGNTYLGLGGLIGFDEIEESTTVEVTGCMITLSLADENKQYLGQFLMQDYLDRVVKIYVGVFDDEERIVSDPVMIFQGNMNNPIMNENPDTGDSFLAVSCTNQWTDFEKIPGRHTNDDEQQAYYPGDRGFKYLPQLVNKKVNWGEHTSFASGR